MSAGAHHDGHEAFDPEPVAEIGADETPSPGWLPIVGAGLFTVAIGFVFFPGADAIAKAPEPLPAAAPVAQKPAAAAAAKKPTDGAKKAPAKRGDGKGIPKGSLKKMLPKK